MLGKGKDPTWGVTSSVQLFILEDCEILRISLLVFFQKEPIVQVAGQSESTGDVSQKILQSGCDSLLIGLRLRHSSGLEFVRKLRTLGFEGCIIALGFSSDLQDVEEIHQAGVDSVVSISLSSSEIVQQTLEAYRSPKL